MYWPMTVQLKSFQTTMIQTMRDKSGLSPCDHFTCCRWPQRRFHDIHVWVCPVYVLDKKISDRNKLLPRSHHCINVGHWKNHAITAPLVLNTETGLPRQMQNKLRLRQFVILLVWDDNRIVLPFLFPVKPKTAQGLYLHRRQARWISETVEQTGKVFQERWKRLNNLCSHCKQDGECSPSMV